MQKIKRSVRQGKTTEFSIMKKVKGLEVANLYESGGESRQGSPYAANRSPILETVGPAWGFSFVP